MIESQTILVLGSLVGLLVLAILWAARFKSVEVEVEDDEQCFCTWYTGMNTECGDPATELRDGFPHCDFHAGIHDALVRAEKMQEDCNDEF